MSRVVTIRHEGLNERKTINTSATTWGELKPQIEGVYNLKDLKVILKQTKATLDIPGAVLPEDDFTIYLMVSKVKSGL